MAEPRILQNGFYKDFGYGFYCTNIEKQAKRWAITRRGDSVVNRYQYTPNNELKILRFGEMSDGRLTMPSDGKTYRLREAITLSKSWEDH